MSAVVIPAPAGPATVTHARGPYATITHVVGARCEVCDGREAIVDALLADVAGGIAVLCDKHPSITPDQVWDRARNIVQGLIGNYSIEPFPEGRS